MILCDFSSQSCVLSVLLGGREGERSVDVGVFLRAYKARASCFNFVLCPCLSGVSWLPWECRAENSPVPFTIAPSTLPSACCLVFELGLCCPLTLHHAGSSLGWRRAFFSPGGSIYSYACIKICSLELSGGLLPSPNPCLCKGLAACSWGQPGLQLGPGGSRASEGELQASGKLCRLFYVPWAELLPCFPPGTVVELDATLWWGSGTPYFTAVFCCADRLRVGASSEPAEC